MVATPSATRSMRRWAGIGSVVSIGPPLLMRAVMRAKQRGARPRGPTTPTARRTRRPGAQRGAGEVDGGAAVGAAPRPGVGQRRDRGLAGDDLHAGGAGPDRHVGGAVAVGVDEQAPALRGGYAVELDQDAAVLRAER